MQIARIVSGTVSFIVIVAALVYLIATNRNTDVLVTFVTMAAGLAVPSITQMISQQKVESSVQKVVQQTNGPLTALANHVKDDVKPAVEDTNTRLVAVEKAVADVTALVNSLKEGVK